VTHRRIRPRPHALAYRVFSLLLDLDEIDGLSRRLRLFSRNRFNLFSFHDRDYGAGTATPLRAQVEDHLRAAGLEPDGGPIRLLTLPRILGYVFNPLSVYFCYRRGGLLAAILYEVSNTFGQRHSYLMPAAGDTELRQECGKTFYVSPFLDMASTYEFRVVPPGERLAISIAVRDGDGPILTAVLAAGRHELSDATLGRAFAGHPFLTLKVIAGIHWEALQLWLKGVRLRRRPPPPASAVTYTDGSRASPDEE
jgi:DUF1365 family protein